MANHPNRGRMPRPLQHLHAIKDDYPDAWSQLDVFRQDKGKDLPNWPDWCFMPLAAWYSIVSAELQVDRVSELYIADVAKLGALGSWRYTQSIYRIDSDLRNAIASTVPSGSLPCDVLYRMPEWCVYIDTPGMKWFDKDLHGFFAHLEWDANTSRSELRLLLDADELLIPQILHLGKWTVTEAVDRAVQESKNNAPHLSEILPSDYIEHLSSELFPLVSLLLYVCSNGVEYGGSDRPSIPSAKRTKKGWKLFPAQKPRFWDLGKETGDRLRMACNKNGESGLKKGPVPHIRRAHWHGYWTGPRDNEQKYILKWLPPAVVAGE